MANEIRLRQNNTSGTISDNPLAQVSTTINSPGFASLPVIGGTNHMILVLDPLGINGAPEIVQVTAHTAAATSVTVTRGFEGSTPRAHIMGTTWFHGPVASDWTLSHVTSSTRPTVPYTGETVYETDTSRFVSYTGTAWQQNGRYFDPPSVRVRRAASENVANNTLTFLTPDTVDFDTDNMWSAGTPQQIRFNTPGLYIVYAWVVWGSDTDYTELLLRLNINGVETIQDRRGGTMSGTNYQSCSIVTKVAANDLYTVDVRQINTNAGTNTGHIRSMGASYIGRGN